MRKLVNGIIVDMTEEEIQNMNTDETNNQSYPTLEEEVEMLKAKVEELTAKLESKENQGI